MNEINDKCLLKYRPDEQVHESIATNCPYNPDAKYKEKKMAEHNPGCLPPHSLKMKVGCSLMLLRNWRVHEGLVNGTRLRLLEVGKKRRAIKCEILTGPKVKKPIVPFLTCDNIFMT